MRRRAKSGAMAKLDAKPPLASVPGDTGLGQESAAQAFTAEFVCVRKCKLWSSVDKESQQIGWLDPGETVAVLARGHEGSATRLKVLRLVRHLNLDPCR
jgi:hypothetical protein